MRVGLILNSLLPRTWVNKVKERMRETYHTVVFVKQFTHRHHYANLYIVYEIRNIGTLGIHSATLKIINKRLQSANNGNSKNILTVFIM